MNIDNLALVKLTDHINDKKIIEPYYALTKKHNTLLYDTIFNKTINNLEKIDKYIPYTKEYYPYNVFYINAIVPENIDILYSKTKYIIIEPLKNQIDNIKAIIDNQIIIEGTIILSKDAVIFDDPKKAKEYLEKNFTFEKLDTKKYDKITKKINEIQTKLNIPKYYQPNSGKTNQDLNDHYEHMFYEYLKKELNLDNNLSLIQIIKSIDINRYEYLIKKYNKLVVERDKEYEEKQITY